MAEEKDKLGNELLSQDFLNFDNIQGTGGGLQNQLAQLGAVQRQAPLYKAATMRSVYQPIVKMIENAEDQIAAGMVAYQLANPELDDSQMFDGTSSIVTDVMTENNVKFKELNRKLGYMTPRHPDYAATVAEIAKINETSINLRNDNKKLLAVRNTIKDLDVQEMSKGQTPGEKLMYNDILVGNTENFQNIDGKLHWVNPNIEDESDPTRAISIDSVNAAGPTMTDDAAFDQHYNLFSAVRKTKAEDLTDQDLNYQINGMFKAVGNDGLKSIIFDSENSELEGDQMVGYAKNGMMFNTSEWFESYYNELGINPQSEQAQQIRADVQRNGVMHSVNGIRVKDHFRDWYAEKLKNAEKTGDGKPEKKNALDFGVDTPETTTEEETSTLPTALDTNFNTALDNAWVKNETDAVNNINSLINLPEGVAVDEAVVGSDFIKLKDPYGIFEGRTNKYALGGLGESNQSKQRFTLDLTSYQMMIDQQAPEGLDVDFINTTKKQQYAKIRQYLMNKGVQDGTLQESYRMGIQV